MTFSYDNIKTLHLELTNKCNAGCPQCMRYVDLDELTPQLIQTELCISDIKSYVSLAFIKQLRKMYACGVFGDPAAAKDCLKIFEYFREINPDIILGMNTNGSLKNNKFWSSMGKLFVKENDSLVFSIDGLSDTNHIYRRHTDFDKIIKNATAFIDSGGIASWDMLVFEHNSHQVEEARELAKELGFTYFRSKVSRRFSFKPVTWLKPPPNHQTFKILGGQISCQALNDESIYIDTHGNLFPCCFIATKVFSPVPEHNIKEHSIEAILNQPMFSEVVDSWDNEPWTICKNTCTKASGRTIFTNQWKDEVKFK